MKKSSLLLLSAVALVSSAAFAGEADPAGQFAQQVTSQRTRAEVNADVFAAVKAGDTQPSTIPLHGRVQPELKSGTTRAQVVAEFLADRDEALAMTGEDSGSSYLAKANGVYRGNEYLAGTPVNAQ